MDRNYFTDEDIEILSKNKYVKKVTNKTISFTKEFKELFIEESNTGKGPTRIFVEQGFNPYILGSNRIKKFSGRIKKKNKKGLPFDDNRGKKSTGRPKKDKESFSSLEDEIEFLKHQNSKLKAENELLKKMEFLIKNQESKKSPPKKDTN